MLFTKIALIFFSSLAFKTNATNDVSCNVAIEECNTELVSSRELAVLANPDAWIVNYHKPVNPVLSQICRKTIPWMNDLQSLYDNDKDGILTKSEIEKTLSSKESKLIFMFMDTDQNGEIDSTDWLSVLQRHDTNNDGVIDREEVQNLITQYTKKEYFI